MIMTSNGTLGDSGRPTGIWDGAEILADVDPGRYTAVDAAGTRSASPFSLQEELTALGAAVEVAAPFTVNVRRDGNMITGQNPMSSAAVAQAVTAAVRDLRQ